MPIREEFLRGRKSSIRIYGGDGYVAGNELEVLSLACHSPIVLTKGNVKPRERNETKLFPATQSNGNLHTEKRDVRSINY